MWHIIALVISLAVIVLIELLHPAESEEHMSTRLVLSAWTPSNGLLIKFFVIGLAYVGMIWLFVFLANI